MTAQAAAPAQCCALLYELPLTSLLLGDSFHPGGSQLTRQLAEQALVGPGSRVLDIACGQGNTARLLADEFGAVVTGVDYSDSLLDRARSFASGAGLGQRLEFRLADAQHLPCADAEFDVVFCECALCTFADAPGALAEMLRVVKPGGRLALSDVVVNAPLPDALKSALARALCITGARSVGDYLELIAAAGFGVPRSLDVSDVLLDTVRQIEERLTLAEVIAELQQTCLPTEFGEPAIALETARDFIRGGGLGYVLFVARKPRV